MNRTWLFAVVTLSLTSPLLAQGTAAPAPGQKPVPEVVAQQHARVTTLRDALDLAARQGPDVAAARAQAALVNVGVERAWGAWKPDLVATGTFDHTSAPQQLDFVQFAQGLSAVQSAPNPPPPLTPAQLAVAQQGNTTIVGANSRYGTLQLSQPLFTPQGAFLLGPARRAAAAASLGADETREQVLLGVARAYLGVKGLYGLLDASRDAEKVALRREDDARSRIAAGTAVEVDLLRAQNDTAVARVNIANIEGQINSLLPLLEALTGERIAPDNNEKVDPDLGLPGDPAKEPWEQAFSVRSSIEQLKAALGAIDYDNFQWLPSVQGIVKGNYNSNSGFAGTNTSYDLIIAASIPLYDRGARYTAKHEDQARLASAQAQLAGNRARARSNWLGAQANLAAANAVLAQSLTQVSLATRAQAQIDSSAKAGVATSLDLSDADNRLFQARSSVAQARAALEVRKAEVAAAEGRLYASVRQ